MPLVKPLRFTQRVDYTYVYIIDMYRPEDGNKKLRGAAVRLASTVRSKEDYSCRAHYASRPITASLKSKGILLNAWMKLNVYRFPPSWMKTRVLRVGTKNTINISFFFFYFLFKLWCADLIATGSHSRKGSRRWLYIIIDCIQIAASVRCSQPTAFCYWLHFW